MYIWILITALLIPWSLTNSAQKDKSDLEQLADDFRILARVTNAISLQKAAIKKEVKARDVIAELLRIADNHFDPIVNIEVAEAISKLRLLEGNVEKTSQNNPQLLDDMNTLLGNLRDFHKCWEHFVAAAADKAVPKDVRSYVPSVIQKLQTAESSCPDTVVDPFSGFEGIESLAQLKTLNESIQPFTACYTEIMKISESLESARTPFESYNALRSLFSKFISRLSKVTADSVILTTFLPEIQDVLRGDYEVLSQIALALDAHEAHSNQLEPPLASHTVAFLDPQELLKVKDDLESPWFEKHIVRGSSTKKLEKYLKPFHEVSVVIQDLVETWKPFHRLDLNGAQFRRVQKVGKYFGKINEFVSLHKGKTIPDGSILEKCGKYLSSSADIKNLETQDATFLHLIEKLIRMLEESYTEFNGELNIKPTERAKHLTDCLNKLSFPNLDDPNVSVEATKKQIQKDFSNCLKKVTQVQLELSDFVMHSENIIKRTKEVFQATAAFEMFESDRKAANLTVLDAQIVIANPEINKTFICLNKENFGVLRTTTKFVEDLLSLPAHEEMIETIDYLQSLNKIKVVYENVENTIRKVNSRPKRAAGGEDLITTYLNNSKLHAENIGVCALALVNLVEVRDNREELLKVGSTYNRQLKNDLRHLGLVAFADPQFKMKDLMKQADELNVLSKNLRTKSLQKMSEIFEEASKIRGLSGNRQTLWEFGRNPIFQNLPKIKKELDLLTYINLDFALYESRVKDGYFTVKALITYFDLILGHTKDHSKTVIVEKHSLSWTALICMAIGIVFLLIIVCLTIYGFTKKGKEKYRNLYLHYFGKPQDFEKRWRYSCFADKEDGKNALLDAVREVNKINMMNAIKKGAYIDAYNKYGNTALHAAAKLGYPEIVEILIRNGANRSLFNTSNQTAEQCVPVKGKDKTDISTRLQAIFQKYKNKKFRKQVPLRFPSTSFHIYIEEGTDVKVTDQFIEKFKAITSFEIIPKTTHCIVKTDSNGIFEADSLEMLSLIFHGIIIVKESWMKDCVQNEKLIEQDSKYLVEKVRFKGVVYDTVIQWSMAMAKSEIPYLHNVIIAAVMKEYDSLIALHSMVTHHGANMCETFPLKENYRIGARPYLHSHLGPLFLIHDGQADLTPYINDPDKMYTIFTEEEFLIFMLKREIKKNTSENPLSVFPDALLISA